MHDVAARARVSFKTVSRVVNGEAGVSAALVERVRRAVDDLDYRPNVGARNLRRSGRTASIGLLLEDVGNPFSAAVQRAVEDVATARGFIVFSASLDEDPAREQELAREFAARRVDGLLLVPASHDQSHLDGELRAGTSIVCLDREARGLAVDSVVSTNALGAAEGVRHLAAGGHRRIAHVGDLATISTAVERYAGYLSALAELDLPADLSIVVRDVRDSAVADAAVTDLLTRPDPPTALFTAQNLSTIGAVRALRRLRLEHTVALLGFDDFPMADLLSPGVSVVAQDVGALGRIAAGLLFERIGGDPGPPRVRLVPTTLLRRGSGEITAPR